MIPKTLYRTVKCFERLNRTVMGDYEKYWKTMGVEVRDYTDEDVDTYVRGFLTGDNLEAYDNLQSITLKTDIWRLCVLYKEGGVYTDVHIRPLLDLNQIFDSDIDHVFVIDTVTCDRRVYNAMMMAKQNSALVGRMLERALLHIRNTVYTLNVLDITGPGVIGYVLRRATNTKSSFAEGIYAFDNGKMLLLSHKNGQAGEEKEMEYIAHKEQKVFQCRYETYREDMDYIGCGLRYCHYFYHHILYKQDYDALSNYMKTGVYRSHPITMERILLEKEMGEEYEW